MQLYFGFSQSTQWFQDLEIPFQTYENWHWASIHPLQHPLSDLKKNMPLQSGFFVLEPHQTPWQFHALDQTLKIDSASPFDVEPLSALLAQTGLKTDLTSFVEEASHPDEKNHPLGCFPRFLKHLGLPVFDIPPSPLSFRENLPDTQDIDWASPILKATENLPLTALDLTLSPLELSHLFLLALFCDTQAHAVLILDTEATSGPPWPDEACALKLLKTHSGYQIHFDPLENLLSVPNHLTDLLVLLDPWLKTPCKLDLRIAKFSEDDDQNPGCHHWFSGTLSSEAFHVNNIYPPVEQAQLSDALALARWVFEGGAFALYPSETHLLKTAEQAFELVPEDYQLKNNQLIIPQQVQRFFAATRLFRQRFADIWDLEQVLKKQSCYDADMASLNDQIMGFFHKPSRGDILFKGLSGHFVDADLSALSPSQENTLEHVEKEMNLIGFERLGAAIWSRGSDVQVIGFGHSEAQAYGVLMFSLLGNYVEFFTPFEEQVSQTTSTNPHLTPEPKRGIYQDSYPGYATPELWEKHQEACRKRHKQQLAIATPPQLTDLLRCVDEFLSYQLKLN